MQAVEKISVVQQVEKGIKDYILNEGVQIGDKLPSEKVLCEELQVGRGRFEKRFAFFRQRDMWRWLPAEELL